MLKQVNAQVGACMTCRPFQLIKVLYVQMVRSLQKEQRPLVKGKA